MWGDPIRPGTEGRGIPSVKKTSWTAYWREENGEPLEESGEDWDVTYPDRLEFYCCGLTEGRMFDTWKEAITFALERKWEK